MVDHSFVVETTVVRLRVVHSASGISGKRHAEIIMDARIQGEEGKPVETG